MLCHTDKDNISIRTGSVEDIDRIREIERAAGELFRGLGMDAVANDPLPDRRLLRRRVSQDQLFVSTAANHIVGYAMVVRTDGNVHLDQVSIDPLFARRRIGARLVEYCVEWAQLRGAHQVSVFTFAHVPWNAPYYLRLGFIRQEVSELGPDLTRLWLQESDVDKPAWDRVALVRPIS